jgi:hypothetical protein
MPEIKNMFQKGVMNKDLDERLVPNGQYRDAMNVQVSTSETSEVGTVQNILGNIRVENIVLGEQFKCVGAVADEKNDVLYWFITSPTVDAIVEYHDDPSNQSTNTCIPILVDINKDVLKFNPSNLITGINIIDNLLFWTDDVNEPKKINIDTFKLNTNNGLTTHSQMFVNETSVGDVTEDHITVIRKRPQKAPSVSFSEISLQEVFTLEDVNFYNINITSPTTTNIFFPSASNTSPYSQGDILLLSDPTQPGNLPQNYTVKVEVVSSTTAAGGYEIDFDVKEISGNYADTPLSYDCIKEVDTEPIFEKELIRFGTRYKYADGEYSAFSPFTQPVFLAGRFGFHPTKDPYNLGMENNSISIALQDLIPTDIPNDVVQLDILFKKERSTTIYSIDSIKPNDPSPNHWQDDTYSTRTVLNNNYDPLGVDDTTGDHGSFVYEYTGQYDITVENIYAALPENQMLRPWDNVPRQALSQEITANRIIYGNYLQNYNLRDISDNICKPKIEITYEERTDHTSSSIDFGGSNVGRKSIKSLRTYYAGVVYGDKYGRETPVFTSKDASIKIPYDQDTSGGFDGTANKSLRLKARLINNPPEFARYYKYFIKQTTGEYYNLTMDRVYKSDGDSNLWISFPSSDRNKVQEGDYFSIKKQVDIEQIIPVENKIKIIDIKNEAPETIKYEFRTLGTGAGDAANLLELFPDSNRSPAAGTQKILINQITWVDEENGLDLEEVTTKSDKIAIQFSISQGGNILNSKKYIVSAWALEETGAATNEYNYSLQLKDVIRDEDNWVESDVGVLNADQGLSTTIYKIMEKDAVEFEGRFFVKIISNPVTQQYLIPSASDLTNFSTIARLDTFNFADSINTYSFGTGLVNSENSSFGSNLTGNDKSNTYIEWQNLNASIQSANNIPGHWFVDATHFIAGQSSSSTDVKHSGKLFAGDPSSPAGRILGLEGVISFPGGQPAYPSAYRTNGARKWNTTEINPNMTSWATADGSGYNLTSSTWSYNNAAAGTWDSSYNSSNNIGNQPVYLHLSYTGVGVNLHDNNFDDFESNLDGLNQLTSSIGPNGIWDMIWEYALDRIPASNIIQPEPTMMAWDPISGTQYPIYGGTYGFNFPNLGGVTYSHWKKITHSPDSNGNVDINNADGVGAFDIGYNDPSAQAVADKIQTGAKFMIEGDDSTVYTILDVHKHHLYNHTAWNPVQQHNSSGAHIMPLSSSVAHAMAHFVDGFSNGNFESSTGYKWQTLKQAIYSFGNTNNRRVSYVIELDKDPRTEGTVDILSATKTSDLQLRFVESYIEPGSNTLPTSPAIFETEAKEDQDLNIYYEASDAIPVELSADQDSLEGHLLGPVGSKVTCNANTFSASTQQNEYPELDFFPTVVGWEGNVVEINNPGFRNITQSPTYSDQLASFYGKWMKFWKKDGSYNQGRILDIEITNEYITKLTIDTDVHGAAASALPYYNCFSFGNGVESNRIRDDFNESYILNGVKASTVLEEPYEEERRKYGLIYSGLYNSTSGVNNLNQFIQAEKITKDLMPSYGSIQKLYARDKDLITLCEDKIIQIFVDKDILYNADGNTQLLATNRVLGTAEPFRGNFGISKNPESFAAESFRAYFTDKQRGAVLRLSMDGLTPISDAGMHDFFRDNLIHGGRLFGSYDNHKEDYNLSISYATGINEVCNPGFEEGLTTDVQLGSNFVLNHDFATFSSTLSSQQVMNGSFLQGTLGWSKNYNSGGNPNASLQHSNDNSPANFPLVNIDGTVSSSSPYANPNHADGSGSVLFDADGSSNKLSTGDGWTQLIVSSAPDGVGTDVDVEWEVFNADAGSAWGIGAFGSDVGMKIEVQDKHGNGFTISKSDIQLGQLGGILSKRYHKFTKTIQSSAFSPDPTLQIDQWTIRVMVVGIEADWDGKKFNVDNISLKFHDVNTGDWTTNTEVTNANGTMVFLDYGYMSQTNPTGVEAGKLYRVTSVLSSPDGMGAQNAAVSVNGMLVNAVDPYMNPQTLIQGGTVTEDVYFPATTNNIAIDVSGGVINVHSMTIQEIEPYGGNVECWNLNGADSDFLYTSQSSSGGSIVFDEAPEDTYLHQDLINTNRIIDFTGGVTCNVAFDVTNYTGSGELTFRLYNDEGEGFEQTINSNGSYLFSGTIGDSSSSTLVSKFGFYVSSTDTFSGEIDNISLVLSNEGVGKTISFNEGSKGWTSFKSFVPEFGLSCVNQYYTMSFGQLWKHHVEQFDENEFLTNGITPNPNYGKEINRNTFYGTHEDSSITPILNLQPAVIKNFNTLNYEGSQSRVDRHLTDSDYYNLYEDVDEFGSGLGYIAGWYVYDIHTDKQEGTLNEFIEKEGKWFNYIKGKPGEIDTAAFNFQGLGIVETID